MSDAEKIWGVSRGSYSDYTVLCVCRTKEDAEAVAAQMGDAGGRDEGMVEEFMLITPPMEKRTRLMMRTIIHDDGAETPQDQYESVRWPFDSPVDAWTEVSWEWYRLREYPGCLKGGELRVHGTNYERVRKVFSDRRAMLLTDPAMRAVENAGGSR